MLCLPFAADIVGRVFNHLPFGPNKPCAVEALARSGVRRIIIASAFVRTQITGKCAWTVRESGGPSIPTTGGTIERNTRKRWSKTAANSGNATKVDDWPILPTTT